MSLNSAVAATVTLLACSLFAGGLSGPPEPVVVHEWGTFTSIAGPDGSALRWLPLNGSSDLPSFVCHAGFKIAMPGTIRMETPVLYFYSSKETEVSVHIQFPNGNITEWFPSANQQAEEISWPSVKILPAVSGNFPNEGNKSHYYAARNTKAASLQVPAAGGPQQERFLFYRGVAGFQPPLSVKLVNNQIVVRNLINEPPAAMILFENQGGRIGYRLGRLTGSQVTLDRPELGVDVALLRGELERLLIASGLFEDEAHAMVETWHDSWFEEGARLFYILPRTAVDTILPLTISPKPASIERTFVGRMELITPEIQAAVLAATKNGDRAALAKYGRFLEPILKQQHDRL
jgi:hypothetical protein